MFTVARKGMAFIHQWQQGKKRSLEMLQRHQIKSLEKSQKNNEYWR
jgi:hypothetical protein